MKLTTRLVLGASALALTTALPAFAQEGDESERKLTTVTVTGSFIQGTPEDAALPVDVLTAGDLKLQGIDLITLNGQFVIGNLDVLIRPANAIDALREVIAPRIASFLSRANQGAGQ